MNNVYSWGTSITAPDGTLFTGFLAALNLDQSDSRTTCFANHCDWRIPNIVELQSIFDHPCNSIGAPACINSAFGPTQASHYWSSSSVVGAAYAAWTVYFNVNFVESESKSYTNYARAVRGGR
jgi:Protein of unknown function (DUF1566)